MITNERQFRITRAEAERFRQAIEDAKTQETDLSPRMYQAMIEGLQSQLDDLLAEVSQYEALKAGEIDSLEFDSLDQLPEVLIAARIAAGLTQKELAERLAMKEQQIQRYEANHYAGASLERLIEIARALSLDIHYRAELPPAVV